MTAAERIPIGTNDDPTTPMTLPGDDASATAPVRVGDAAQSASRESARTASAATVEDGAWRRW